MPIFQDDFGGGHDPPSKPATRPTSTASENVLARKLSEESIRTDLCEGPLRESLEEESNILGGDTLSGHGGTAFETSDRVELIERLKRGESPTWLPNRNLESLLQDFQLPLQRPLSNNSHSSPLLPAAELIEKSKSSENVEDSQQAGLQIERPRSALHSGDFTEAHQTTSDGNLLQASSNIYRSDQNSWLSTSPPRNFTPYQLDPRFPPPDRSQSIEQARSRAPSLSSSYSSSFILKPPTSPLVQSESNEELDLSSQVNPIDIASHPRRHTLQAHSVQSTPSGQLPSILGNRASPSLRRDNTYPYQAHQPRRSLTSSNSLMMPVASPQTPAFLHSRRPSVDNSPLHASMVGSYEESILRGRMSTTPSKPLDFVAQIGVLGLGKCKASLRCPAHVTLPFPAVFYSYESTHHGRVTKSEDGPSPYVGQIDLENGLPNPDEEAKDKKKRANLRARADDVDVADGSTINQTRERLVRRTEKQKRRSTSPRAPLGGSYRIPEKGQVQIIIKNPNKTAVKLFLVPYDLNGMQPGTKTFIRQRSYSTGPIIDSALSSTQPTPAPTSLDRPTLRYLVHLHICSPSRGRFYLYKNIRVVFANRVPDGKEKLRNEISLPEPRFSTYKPGRESSLSVALSNGAGASLAAEKAFRRRSSGFGLGFSNRNYDTMDGVLPASERRFGGGSSITHSRDFNTLVQPIPFSLRRKVERDEDGVGSSVQEPSMTASKIGSIPPSRESGSSMSWDSSSTGIGAYDKLHKGDFGYGGNAFASSPDGKQLAEGLLAQKLRDLGVGMLTQHDPPDSI